MSFVRYYRMTAREGAASELHAALENLRGLVLPLPGCEGVELLRNTEVPDQFVFMERWSSVESHREGGKALGKQAFAPVMAALAGPPEAAGLIPA
jgi:heme-degrading monooxygenase HmoA